MNKPNALWVLIILQKKSDKSWSKANEMEVNTLMKTMAEKAGLDNFHLTNCSAQTRIIQTKQSRARSFCENKLVRIV